MNRKKIDLTAPVVVGGLGGSGTRVVAQILRELGVYIGNVNDYNDNLWFAFLLRRPKWIKTSNGKNVKEGIEMFNRVNFGLKYLKIKDLGFIIRAMLEQTFNNYNRKYNFFTKLLLYTRVFKTGKTDKNHSLWGWKEANAHIFIEELAEFYPNMKFILLVRNGLDMAYSDNQNQLLNWGDRYDVDTESITEKELPKASLKYWNKANTRSIELGEKLLGKKRFIKLNFEDLCYKPEEVITEIIEFLELDKNDYDIKKLAQIPKPPKTMGRYKDYDLSAFDKEDVEAVKKISTEV